MNELQIAIFGAGHLGKIHARLLKSLPGVHATIVETDELARRWIERELQLPTCEQLQDIGGAIDGAIIVTPTSTHYDIAADLIDRGMHVFVEKPLCATAAKARSLCELAERNGVTVQVGHVERFNPAFIAATDQLPPVHYVECNRLTSYPIRATDVSVVLDLMIHDIDLVLSLMRSPVRRVDAQGTRTIGPYADSAVAWLEFENGTRACLKASRVCNRPERSMNLWHPSGQTFIDLGGRQAERMVAAADAATTLRSLTPDGFAAARDEMFQRYLPVTDIAIGESNAILKEQEEFVACIRGDQFPSVSGRDGLAAVEVAEWIENEISDFSTRSVSPKIASAA